MSASATQGGHNSTRTKWQKNTKSKPKSKENLNLIKHSMNSIKDGSNQRELVAYH